MRIRQKNLRGPGSARALDGGEHFPRHPLPGLLILESALSRLFASNGSRDALEVGRDVHFEPGLRLRRVDAQ